jgi:hypothetical protein
MYQVLREKKFQKKKGKIRNMKSPKKKLPYNLIQVRSRKLTDKKSKEAFEALLLKSIMIFPKSRSPLNNNSMTYKPTLKRGDANFEMKNLIHRSSFYFHYSFQITSQIFGYHLLSFSLSSSARLERLGLGFSPEKFQNFQLRSTHP